MPYAILLAAALSVENPFLHTFHHGGAEAGGSGGGSDKAAKQVFPPGVQHDAHACMQPYSTLQPLVILEWTY